MFCSTFSNTCALELAWKLRRGIIAGNTIGLYRELISIEPDKVLRRFIPSPASICSTGHSKQQTSVAGRCNSIIKTTCSWKPRTSRISKYKANGKNSKFQQSFALGTNSSCTRFERVGCSLWQVWLLGQSCVPCKKWQGSIQVQFL